MFWKLATQSETVQQRTFWFWLWMYCHVEHWKDPFDFYLYTPLFAVCFGYGHPKKLRIYVIPNRLNMRQAVDYTRTIYKFRLV